MHWGGGGKKINMGQEGDQPNICRKLSPFCICKKLTVNNVTNPKFGPTKFMFVIDFRISCPLDVKLVIICCQVADCVNKNIF